MSGRTRQSSSRSVSFAHVEVREYARTLGDHPGTDGMQGPPLSLDWEILSAFQQEVEEYESTRRPLVVTKLDGQQRRNILTWCAGETPEDIERREKESQRIRRQRTISKNTYGLQSAGRKLKSVAKAYISNHRHT